MDDIEAGQPTGQSSDTSAILTRPQLSELRRAVAAPDPARGALPMRVLPDAAADGLLLACGEHSTIVRMSDTDQMECVRCGGSMLKPV